MLGVRTLPFEFGEGNIIQPVKGSDQEVDKWQKWEGTEGALSNEMSINEGEMTFSALWCSETPTSLIQLYVERGRKSISIWESDHKNHILSGEAGKI